jgi:hypothetical protein
MFVQSAQSTVSLAENEQYDIPGFIRQQLPTKHNFLPYKFPGDNSLDTYSTSLVSNEFKKIEYIFLTQFGSPFPVQSSALKAFNREL